MSGVDLAQWIGAQLDADTAVARTALAERDGTWRYIETPGGDHRVIDGLGYSVVEDSPVESEPWFTLPHIAEHDPARVLREVDAKRQLLADITAERHLVNQGDCWYTCPAATEERDGGETCDDDRHGAPCDCGRDARVERQLRLLALPYTGREGYREEWTP